MAGEEGKKWDGDGVPLEDTNVAGIGSEEDIALRKAAAETEPAWEGVGLEPGLWVWRIENFQVVPWPRERYGEFHMADSYIVLQCEAGDEEEEDGPFERQIYFWLGKDTAIDERGVAAYKTVELDDFFGGACGQNREVMNKESEDFMELFPDKFVHLKGGVESGFDPAQPDVFMAMLLQVRRTKKKVIIADEVTLETSSLNHRDSFILDAGEKIYVWHGDEASPFVKNDANMRAQNMESDRNGSAQVLYPNDDESEHFWELLGGQGDITAAADVDDEEEPDFGDGILYYISIDEGRQLEVEQVGRRDLDRSMLDTHAVMMLDTRTEIFLWLGKESSPLVKRNALRTAMDYLKTNERDPESTAVHMLKEGAGQKNKVWKSIFPRAPPKKGGRPRPTQGSPS